MMRQLIVIIFLLPLILKAQTDTLMLDETTVYSGVSPVLFSKTMRQVFVMKGEQIRLLPVSGIGSALAFGTGTDVRSRGAHSVQSDISIRGGTFEQTAILLNGVKMNDPQTGHHNLNIPIDETVVDQIETLSGSGARLFGSSALTGAVNIIVRPDDTHYLKGGFYAGDFGLRGITALYNNPGKIATKIHAAQTSSSGYRANTDFRSSQVYMISAWTRAKHSLMMQAGYSDKAFGANSFYSLIYPEQFERTRTLTGSIRYNYVGDWHFSPQLYYRRHQDRFELFREGAQWYERQGNVWVKDGADTAQFLSMALYSGHNYHLTHTAGVDIPCYTQWRGGKTVLGTSIRSEKIYSNVLGSKMRDTIVAFNEDEGFYNKTALRQLASVFADHSFSYYGLDMSAGIMMQVHSDYNPMFFPGIDLSYKLGSNFNLMASIAQTVRVPSYTELYYQSPVHKSNKALKPEDAINYELSGKFVSKQIQSGISLFFRDSKNSIDWVRHPDSTYWSASNLTHIITAGTEANVSYTPAQKDCFVNTLSLSLAYTYKEKAHTGFESQYVMDYLKYKAKAQIIFNLTNRASLSLVTSYKHRDGSWYDPDYGHDRVYKSSLIFDTKFIYSFKRVGLFAELINITQAYYYDYGGIPMPGRWFSAGFNYKFTIVEKKIDNR